MNRRAFLRLISRLPFAAGLAAALRPQPRYVPIGDCRKGFEDTGWLLSTELATDIGESLDDAIYNISPVDTTFMRMRRCGKSDMAFAEWQADTLRPLDFSPGAVNAARRKARISLAAWKEKTTWNDAIS